MAHCKINFANPPIDTPVFCISGTLIQTHKYLKAPQQYVEGPTQTITIFRIDNKQRHCRETHPTADFSAISHQPSRSVLQQSPFGDALCTFSAGWSESFSQTFHVPANSELRPSTEEGTRSPIRTFHLLRVRIAYQDAQKHPRYLDVSKTVQLASVSP